MCFSIVLIYDKQLKNTLLIANALPGQYFTDSATRSLLKYKDCIVSINLPGTGLKQSISVENKHFKEYFKYNISLNTEKKVGTSDVKTGS